VSCIPRHQTSSAVSSCIPRHQTSSAASSCIPRHQPLSAASVLHPWASNMQRCECPASLGIKHPALRVSCILRHQPSSAASSCIPVATALQHCKHPASPGISPPALRVSCIPGHLFPIPLAPRGGGNKDRFKDETKRSQTPRPPRLRAVRSKAQPGSEVLSCTVCQSQKTVWRVAAVGFPCSKSWPEMLCADWRPHPFPTSHSPSCSSLSTPHTSRISQLCIHPGSIIS